MASLNKVQLIGNVGKDPETRYTTGGDAIANLSLATSESWTDKSSGEKVEKTEWHLLVFFKKLAEIVGQYVTKGKSIYVEGRLQTRKWEKDGVTHYSTEIVCDKMILLGGKRDGDSEERAPATKSKPTADLPPPATEFDDDIPF